MEPKAAASLTSGLLARKGAARPAMRRPTVAGLGPTLGPRAVSSLDDLGWNDMGEDVDAAAPVAVPTPSPVAQHIAAIQQTLARCDEGRAQVAVPPSVPAPVAEAVLAPIQTKITQPAPPKVKAKARVTPVPVKALDMRKSAFTLRIDEERHLRLRLLSAVTNQSAQQLLIGALDALIAQHPNIDALAADPKTRPASTD
ncbi:MAG: hypothetical protein ABW169_01830 [Sphingobium sp.]